MDAISAEQHVIRDEDTLNTLYGEVSAGAIAKEIDYIHPHYRAMIEASPQSHVLCTPTESAARQLYVDFSAYASVGLDPAPDWGGVCRGSPSHIVNIVGGGGVAPLFADEVLAEVL